MRVEHLCLLLFGIVAKVAGCASDDDAVNPDNAGKGGMAGQSGASAEAGAGQGGAGETCPAFIGSAEGKPCSSEGQICGDGADNPCEFGNFIRCTDGIWVHQEAFPDPNCGAGGAGQAGGGAAGAAP